MTARKRWRRFATSASRALPGGDAMTQAVDRPQDMVPLTREGALAVLTLNFPARRNAYCLQMRTQLRERLEAAYADGAVRAIVLTGAAGHFCSGGDVTEMQ